MKNNSAPDEHGEKPSDFAKSYIRKGATYKAAERMKKNPNNPARNSSKAIIALFVLGLCVSTLPLIPIANAAEVGMSLSATQGSPGTTIGVYGVGFASGAVTINFNSKQVSRTSTGMFGRISSGFTIPDVAPGIYPVTATDSAGNTGTAMLTVIAKGSTSSSGTISVPPTTATIALSSTQGPMGTSVTVSGSGFTPGVSVSVNFATSYVTGTTADSSGRATASFTVPTVAIGMYTVSASDARGKFASATFTVTQAGSTAQIGQNPTGIPANTNDSSITLIAIVLVVAAAVSVTILTMTLVRGRRGKQEKLLEETKPGYQPKTPPTSRPSAPPRYGQTQTTGYNRPTSRTSSYNLTSPYRSTLTRSPPSSVYSQTRRYVQSTGSMKTCPHCRQLVKADYSICPNCRKRLK